MDQRGMINYICLDCEHEFDEFEAVNCSLCPDEYNPGCPKCEGDHVAEVNHVPLPLGRILTCVWSIYSQAITY